MNQQPPMSAIILAGGNSQRMKENKALLPIQGLPLILRVARNLENYFQEIIISAHPAASHASLPYRVVPDKLPGQGPLMGILCGLEASSNSINFVTACDIPEIDTPFLHRMMAFSQEYEMVIPMSGKNRFEPLFAFYNKRLIPRIEKLLERNIRQIIQLFPLGQVKYIPLYPGDWFYNLNNIEDYHRYIEKIKGNFASGGQGAFFEKTAPWPPAKAFDKSKG